MKITFFFAPNVFTRHPGLINRLKENEKLGEPSLKISDEEVCVAFFGYLWELPPLIREAKDDIVKVVIEDSNRKDFGHKRFHWNLVLTASTLRTALQMFNGIRTGKVQLNDYWNSIHKDITRHVPSIPLSERLEQLGFNPRIINSFLRGGIQTLGDLLSTREDELLDLPNFGKTSLEEVKSKLELRGLSLSPSVSLEDPLESLGFSYSRLQNLNRRGLEKIGDLVTRSEDELSSLGVREANLREIKVKLKRKGLALKAD
jgi:hypothetical protein